MSDDVLSDEAYRAHKERLTNPVALGEVLGATFSLAARTALVGVPVAVLFGLGATAVSIGGEALIDHLSAWTPESRENAVTVLLGVGGFGVLYAILQYFRRETATRTSWLPSLFALPALFTAFGIWMIGGPVAQQMPAVQFMPVILAGVLLWRTFFGSFAAVAWIRTGNQAAESQPVDAGGALQEAGRRTVEVAAVHGGKVTAVQAGMQLIVVGIFYALQLAFADPVVVLDPKRPAIRRAGNLSYGMRSRIFRVLFVWMLAYWVLYAGAAIAIDGVATYQASLFDPTANSVTVWLVADILFGLTLWLETLSMLVMYRDREAQVKAKAALRKHKKAQETQTVAKADPGVASPGNPFQG